MVRIVADSSCDLFTLDYEDFITVPLTVYTDERSFLDDENLNVTEMLDYLEKYKDRSYTSCPRPPLCRDPTTARSVPYRCIRTKTRT